MTIIKFLEQCLYLDEHTSPTPREFEEIQFKRKILEHHKKWPVLIEERPQFVPSAPVDNDDFGNYTYTMMQRYMWLVEEEYRKMFGIDPPTAPIIKDMAKLYSDYPGFNPEWN